MATTSNTIDSVKDFFSSSIEKASSSISNVSSSVKNSYTSLFDSGSIYIGLIVVIIICVLVAYFLYYIITTRLFLQSKVIAEQTRTPVLCTEKKIVDFKFDKTGNGERRSFTFWIYIHDMNKYSGMYKNVFSINTSDRDIDIDKSSPYVFLDSTNNRMYIRFSSRMTRNTNLTNYSSITSSTLPTFMKQGIVIPYVPLQRWVHIAVVCNANSYKNYLYAYVDGDLVNTASTGEIDKHFSERSEKTFRDLDLNVMNYLSIGGRNDDFAEGPGFSGLVSKITTYNYELNQKDIYEDYYKGPISGFLSRLGLSNYGVRNPIYKI